MFGRNNPYYENRAYPTGGSYRQGGYYRGGSSAEISGTGRPYEDSRLRQEYNRSYEIRGSHRGAGAYIDRTESPISAQSGQGFYRQSGTYYQPGQRQDYDQYGQARYPSSPYQSSRPYSSSYDIFDAPGSAYGPKNGSERCIPKCFGEKGDRVIKKTKNFTKQ